jgi:NodT family efflux transporter outer membrane factor (OMF) lipoprotein
MKTHPLQSARPLLVGVLALALTACASSRGLQPQGRLLDMDGLQAGRSLAGDDLSASGFPAVDWWRALGDAQLDALVAEGLRNSPSLEVADARLRQAQAQVAGSKAERMPSLSVSPGYTGMRLPESMLGEVGGHYAGSVQTVLNFSYGVDLWGGKRVAWEAAVDSRHAAAVDAQAARLDLSAAIVQGYAQLAHAGALQRVANDELARSEQLLQLTRQRRSAGIDSDLQVRQAEARIPLARQQQLAAQQQIDAARNGLAALLGQGPDRGLQIAVPEALSPLALQLPGVLPSELLGRRPDVVAARWRVDASDKQIHVAKSHFYPSLNLMALGGVVSKDVGSLLESGSTFGLLAPALSLPIFDGGRLRAGLAKSDADYDLAVASYNTTVVQALREVADQVNAVRSLATQVEAQQQAVATAQSANALAQQRYRAGIGNYLDVLGTQDVLLQAQQRLSNLQSQQLLSSVQLSAALGGGYQPGDDALPGTAKASDLPNS